MDWLREIPEEYLVSLALFFNEVIDDLGDESLEKIDLKTTHAQINPLPVDPSLTDSTRDKHVANDDANR